MDWFYFLSRFHPLASSVLVSALLLCSDRLEAQQTAPRWTKVTDHAAFTPRDSCGEAVFQDRMWLLGGWMDSYKDPPRDVWSSADGQTWKLVTPQAAWKHSDFPMAVAFQDRLWVMGGWHGGRLAHASASNSVWSSANGSDWKLETPTAGWSPRMAGGLVVFNNRLWILGGIQKYYYGTDKDLLNDVWSSADGRHWEQATPRASWSPRAYHAAQVFNNKLWVLGGGNYLPGHQDLNDVWSSADGITWTQISPHAPWKERIWFGSAVYRDHLWVLGGSSGKPRANLGDAWYSRDGHDWKELKTNVVWKARHEHSCYVFKDKLWVVTGHAAPLDNQVWSLELPRGWTGPGENVERAR